MNHAISVQIPSFLRHISALIRLGRPKFLLGGFALFGLGTLIAYVMGYGFQLSLYLWGQLAVTAAQLMTHYSNDYFDVETDRANRTPTQWSGGSRVLVRGELPRWSALLVALVMAMVACLSITALLQKPGVHQGQILVIFSIVCVLSWGYSSPPFRLHSRGLGEPTVAIVVPFLTPLSAFVLQAGSIQLLPIVLTAPLILLQLVMLLTLQIPDERSDRLLSKKTWTVLFGVKPIVTLCSVLIPLSFVLAFGGISYGVPRAVGWIWLSLTPLGIYQELCYFRRDYKRPSKFNRLEFGSVALFFSAIIGDIIGLIIAS